jgi:hypothetical protein
MKAAKYAKKIPGWQIGNKAGVSNPSESVIEAWRNSSVAKKTIGRNENEEIEK